MITAHFGIAYAHYVQMYKDRDSRPDARQVLEWFCRNNSSLIGSCCQGGSEDASIKKSEQTIVDLEQEASPLQEPLPVPLTPFAGDGREPISNDPLDIMTPTPQVHTLVDIERVVAGETESSTSLSLGHTSTTTGRSTSLAQSSIGSQHPVQWSSGVAHYLELPPVDSQHTCNCVPRTKERLILCLPNVHLFVKAKQPTMEINENCDLHKDMLYVYEFHSGSDSEKSKIWHRTRRLVVSYKREPNGRQLCISFWLPLTDIHYVVEDASLRLSWSDCNTWFKHSTVNNKPSWDCIFDSTITNNEIVLRFAEARMAKVVERNLCTIYSDSDGVKELHMAEVVGQQRLLVVDVRGCDQKPIHYRLACLATYEPSQESIFKAFIHWRNLDLDIKIESDVMVIRFDQVSSPYYKSNINNELWKDESRTALFKESELVFSEYSMKFPYSSENLTFLPEGTCLSFTQDLKTVKLIE